MRKAKITSFPSFVFFLLTSIILSGCGTESREPLRIGTNIWLGYEPLYLAREMNFIDNASVKLLEFSSNSESISAFRNNAIDAVCLTFDEVLLLLQSEIDFKLVLVMDVSNGADVILGKPGMKRLQDVKGKRIGVESTAVGAYMLARALQKSGLARNDIQVVQLDINEHERAFTEGKIDAVVTFEPVYSRLMEQGAQTLFDSSQIPGEIIDVLVVRTDYFKKNKHTVKKLLQGWYRALGHLKEKPMDAANIMRARLEISSDEIIASSSGLKFPDQLENNQMLNGEKNSIFKTGENLVNIMLEQKLLRKQVNPASIVEASILE